MPDSEEQDRTIPPDTAAVLIRFNREDRTKIVATVVFEEGFNLCDDREGVWVGDLALRMLSNAFKKGEEEE